MNPTLLTLLIASGVALCALLVVASGLIHTSLRRRKAAAAGEPDIPSRILDDLRPVEDLLVDFVRHSREMTDLLAILSPLCLPTSFAHLVHEIRIGRNGSNDPKIAANLVGAALFILGLARLIRITSGGFVITEVGREVQRRITDARQPRTRSPRAAVAGPEDRAELQPLVAAPIERLSRLQLNNETNTVNMNSRVELVDLESKERMQFTLVLPRDADIEQGKISVLAPLGAAMIGCRTGDSFEWRVPYGRRRLKVAGVYFQPEASLRKAA